MNSAQGYWNLTRQPIYSAALVLPFLAVYELGLICLRSQVLNGGDAILLNLGGHLLHALGFEASLASILALLIAFLLWQFKKKGPWTLEPSVLLGMCFESLLYAVVLLVVLGYFVPYLPKDAHSVAAGVASSLPSLSGLLPASGAATEAAHPVLQGFVLYCGAGVYEEFVFRVLLLGLLILVCSKLLHMEHAHAAVWAVILSSLLFSAFHHIGGEPFHVGPFLQRVFAGLYFSAIYLNRSFGIAAASHALYDIVIGCREVWN